jgi:hypothetical protein
MHPARPSGGAGRDRPQKRCRRPRFAAATARSWSIRAAPWQLDGHRGPAYKPTAQAVENPNTLPILRRALLALCATAWLAACGADGRYVIIGSTHAPSASGTVEVDELDGDNTQVAIHVEYLYPPGRVADGMTTYMVWFVPPSGSAVRGGVLKYNVEQRTGDLSATSPFRHFTVKITAERDARAGAPSENVTATQEILVE